MIEKSKNFIESRKNLWEDLGHGVKRQFMGYDKNIMMVKVTFEKGAVGPLHKHFHSQSSYVVSGEFEVSIDGVKKVLSAGDGFYIPPDVEHGAVCLKAGMLIDVFSPVREDFLKKA